MRFRFPTRERKPIPLVPLLSVVAFVLTLVTLFGRGGGLHALAMRAHRSDAEGQVNLIRSQNEVLKSKINKISAMEGFSRRHIANSGGPIEIGETAFRFVDPQKMQQSNISLSPTDSILKKASHTSNPNAHLYSGHPNTSVAQKFLRSFANFYASFNTESRDTKALGKAEQ